MSNAEGSLNCTRYKPVLIMRIISEKGRERKRFLTESNVDGYYFTASIIIYVRREKGEKNRKWQIACIERLVINDGTWKSRIRLSDFGNDILLKRHHYGIQIVLSNCCHYSLERWIWIDLNQFVITICTGLSTRNVMLIDK